MVNSIPLLMTRCVCIVLCLTLKSIHSFLVSPVPATGTFYNSKCSSKRTSQLKQSQEENKIIAEEKEEILSSDSTCILPDKATVWTEFQRISERNKIEANLGQGFPNWSPPLFCRDSLVQTVMDTNTGGNNLHQYTRTAGHPRLVNELATRYSMHLHKAIDPFEEVAITVGASQALYLSLQTLVKEGDEVLVFEPFFDLYINQIRLAGGVPVAVPLTFVPYEDDIDSGGGEWVLEEEKLQAKISRKTRAIILNSPHNPTGKVFTLDEMQMIADVMLTSANPNCVVLSDEVYKYIIHAPPKDQHAISEECTEDSGNAFIQRCEGHVHFCTLPNMYDRTITISSAGKTFSATGWQVGWCIGPSHLIKPIHTLMPYVQFCPSTLMQEALARSLHLADMPYEGYTSYYEYLKETYVKKRDLLVTSLNEAGFGVPDYDRTPGGGFFILARISDKIIQSLPPNVLQSIRNVKDGDDQRLDWIFCKWLAQEKGVLCIPSSPFFSDTQETTVEKDGSKGKLSDRFIRIAFCKLDETIETASLVFQGLVDDITAEAEEGLVGASMEYNNTDVMIVK